MSEFVISSSLYFRRSPLRSNGAAVGSLAISISLFPSYGSTELGVVSKSTQLLPDDTAILVVPDLRVTQIMSSTVMHLTNTSIVTRFDLPLDCSNLNTMLMESMSFVVETWMNASKVSKKNTSIRMFSLTSLDGLVRSEATQQSGSATTFAPGEKVPDSGDCNAGSCAEGGCCCSSCGNSCWKFGGANEDAGTKSTDTAKECGACGSDKGAKCYPLAPGYYQPPPQQQQQKSLEGGKFDDQSMLVKVTYCDTSMAVFQIHSQEILVGLGLLPTNHKTMRVSTLQTSLRQAAPNAWLERSFLRFDRLEKPDDSKVTIRPRVLQREMTYVEDLREFHVVRAATLDIGLGGILSMNFTQPLDCTKYLNPRNVSFRVVPVTKVKTDTSSSTSPGSDGGNSGTDSGTTSVNITSDSNITGATMIACYYDTVSFQLSDIVLNRLSLGTPPLPSPLPMYEVVVTPPFAMLNSRHHSEIVTPIEQYFKNMPILLDAGAPCISNIAMEPNSDILVITFDEIDVASTLPSGMTTADGLLTLSLGTHFSVEIEGVRDEQIKQLKFLYIILIPDTFFSSSFFSFSSDYIR